jgi:acarbose 7IV-phosphotransferase
MLKSIGVKEYIFPWNSCFRSKMSNKEFDVVVIGNAGIDTNVYLMGEDIDFNVEANFTQNIDMVGQAGGFAARGYNRLGLKTSFIGYVGDDFQGRYITEVLAEDGIDTSGIAIDPAGTSRSVNIMYKDGRRKNFYDGKSHMILRMDEEKCRGIFSKSKLAHFNIPNWARFLLPLAKQAGTTIACDIQDVVDIQDPYRREFVEFADFLFFSSVNFPDPGKLMTEFLKINPNLIILSGMGSKGCALGTKSHVQYFQPVRMKEPVIDTNGAGDALAVGFLTSYLFLGCPLEEAVNKGQIAARHTCTLKGDSNHLITREHMERVFHDQI